MNSNPSPELHNVIFGIIWLKLNKNVKDMCWNALFQPINIDLDSNKPYDFIKDKVAIYSNSIINASDRKSKSYDFTTPS